MANLLESSATTETVAPSYYNNYLSNLATKGTEAADAAKFVGAQPLQTKAFEQVEGAAGAYEPQLTSASNTLNNAATSVSPLATGTPYFQSAVSDPSQAAASYMTPYIRSVVDALGDTGARNIRQNLSPLATAGAVGSGQFGSKRGAEVLGQTMSNANRDILNAQSQAMNTGYQNALNAAIQQNQIENAAGANAANAASQGQQNLTAAGAQQGALSKINQELNLNKINAMSTLGGQEQTIKQNEQNYPLTKYSTLSGLMAGQTIPTSQKQTAKGSPLSAAASLGATTAGLFQKPANGGPSLWENLTGSKDVASLAKSIGSGLDSAGNYIKDAYGNLTKPTTGSEAGTIGGTTYDPDTSYDDYGNVIPGSSAGNIGGTTYDPNGNYDYYGNNSSSVVNDPGGGYDYSGGSDYTEYDQ